MATAPMYTSQCTSFVQSMLQSSSLSLFNTEQDKWKVGKVEPLSTQDDSPFLGQIEEGHSQLALENGLYRAPAFAYSTSASDFLLIRNAAGVIMLRELTGCIAVGQEVPFVRVPIPLSRDVRSAQKQIRLGGNAVQ